MTIYLQSNPLSEINNIKHAFFTRNGGVSIGAYSSLNGAFSKADKTENILENRRRMTNVLDGKIEQLVSLRQTHSDIIHTVTQPFHPEHIPAGDGLVTNIPNLILGVITADCVPVMLYDQSACVVGIVHAGWRGAISKVLNNAIYSMQQLGANNISAAIGPCIWQKNYEVGQDVYDKLDRADKYCLPNKSGKWQFDLPGYVENKLKKLGVRNIASSLANTYVDEDNFFSYRRASHCNEGGTGHNMSMIKLTTS